MPKMKTHKGAAKRMKVTGSGKVKHASARRQHKLACKSPNAKRNLRNDSLVASGDMCRVKRMLGL